MIPSNILLLASIFVLLYFIGFGLTIYGLYQSIKDNKRFSMFIHTMILSFLLSMLVSYIIFSLMEKYTDWPQWLRWLIVLTILFILF